MGPGNWKVACAGRPASASYYGSQPNHRTILKGPRCLGTSAHNSVYSGAGVNLRLEHQWAAYAHTVYEYGTPV